MSYHYGMYTKKTERRHFSFHIWLRAELNRFKIEPKRTIYDKISFKTPNCHTLLTTNIINARVLRIFTLIRLSYN